MNLQKQLEYNKGLFMYRVLSNEVPEYISNLYTQNFWQKKKTNIFFISKIFHMTNLYTVLS